MLRTPLFRIFLGCIILSGHLCYAWTCDQVFAAIADETLWNQFDVGRNLGGDGNGGYCTITCLLNIRRILAKMDMHGRPTALAEDIGSLLTLLNNVRRQPFEPRPGMEPENAAGILGAIVNREFFHRQFPNDGRGSWQTRAYEVRNDNGPNHFGIVELGRMDSSRVLGMGDQRAMLTLAGIAMVDQNMNSYTSHSVILVPVDAHSHRVTIIDPRFPDKHFNGIIRDPGPDLTGPSYKRVPFLEFEDPTYRTYYEHAFTEYLRTRGELRRPINIAGFMITSAASVYESLPRPSN